MQFTSEQRNNDSSGTYAHRPLLKCLFNFVYYAQEHLHVNEYFPTYSA